MLAPSLGFFVYRLNVFLFGEFAFYYPFALFVLNYLCYTKHYKLQNFTRRELFGLGFCVFACLLLFAVFYKDTGYILELFYTIFSVIFGHLGTGIIALLFLLFSIVLLFPQFIKEIFKLEIDFSFLEKIEKQFKILLMRVFGGELEKDQENKVEFTKNNTDASEDDFKIANNSIDKDQTLILKEKENLNKETIDLNEKHEKSIKQDFTENLEQEPIQQEQSFIHEKSKQVLNFVQKASRTHINLDEDFNFFTQGQEDMIPQRFLKPKNAKDFEALDEKENLDIPSYKRKNIELLKPKDSNYQQDIKQNLGEKELLKTTPIIQSSKYVIKEEQDFDTHHTFKFLGKENSKSDKDQIPPSSKEEYLKEYTQENTSDFNKDNQKQDTIEILDFNENDFKLDPEELRDNTLDFEPIVEELDQPIIEEPITIKLDEFSDTKENVENKNTESFVEMKDLNSVNLEENKTKNTLAKEIALNKELLKELEQGEFSSPKDFTLPPLEFLASPLVNKQEINEEEIDKKIYDLLEKLRRFKIGGDVISTYTGPVVTTFEFRPSADVKVSRILNLQDDLAMALKARSIRIQAPIPGKDVVGIEVPNEQIQTIYLREILESELFINAKSPLTIALGKDIVGNAFVTDLKKLPHLLIAGTTGSGKSVGINAMLLSLLYRNSPKTLRLMMIDPKMLEFSIYNDIPHLLTPVITDPKKAVNALSNMVAEMERRYRLMADAKTKNIENYNEKMKDLGQEQLPFIVVIIDELADLMMNAGKDVEFYIARLAQMARASGIHLIVATQRPSVDVVTGLIKANLPSRISYKVGQKIDSKVILDAMGAESLLGRGDCLFTPPGTSAIVRLHAPFASEFEIEKIVDFLKSQQVVEYDENFLKDTQGSLNASPDKFNENDLDELYEDAKRVVLEDQKTSISYLQRRLKIGYNRAANLIEQLTQTGILSEPDAKGQREIL